MFDEKLLFNSFMDEGREQVELLELGLLRLESLPDDLETIHALYRATHTLKGGCFVVGCTDLGNFCHMLEETFGTLRRKEMTVSSSLITALLQAVDFLKSSLTELSRGAPFDAEQATLILAGLEQLIRRLSVSGSPCEVSDIIMNRSEAGNRDLAGVSSLQTPGQGSEGTIRINQGKIERLVDNVGELLIVHSMLRQTLGNYFPEGGVDTLFGTILDQMQRLGRDVQEKSLSLRMQPVAEVFQRCERAVRDLAAATGKRVVLQQQGGETELDKGILQKLVDPLMHLLRNAIDHGLEHPASRLAQGKSEEGTITLTAEQRGGVVFIELKDDGRGLDSAAILLTARQQGLASHVDELSEAEIYNLVFRPGFSTAAEVTELSGRGVGMDVVRRNIELLQGSVQLTTVPGRGTTVTIKLPLTMAILDGLAVRAGAEIYLLPLGYVLESFRVGEEELKIVNGKEELVYARREWLPVVRLHRQLGITCCSRTAYATLVILECGIRRCALLVDEIIGQQQVVLKSLGAATPDVKCVAGGTILGDGRVALVIDVAGLLATALR